MENIQEECTKLKKVEKESEKKTFESLENLFE